MAMRDLIPWSRNRSSVPSVQGGGELDPFFTLHREMNRLFDDAFRGFDGLGRGAWPSLEVQDAGQEYRIAVELPGVEEPDVEVLMDDGVLIIRGEKRSQRENQDRTFSERSYGRFERRLTLGRDVDEPQIKATFRNGLLEVIAPKSAQAAERTKRIPINAPGTAH